VAKFLRETEIEQKQKTKIVKKTRKKNENGSSNLFFVTFSCRCRKTNNTNTAQFTG
jgi:hypothetical protein